MSNIDLFSMALRNLYKRKLRTFLTILGVIIGTAAIIVMVSLGIGMNISFEQQISQQGDLRVINVYSNQGGMMYSSSGSVSIMSSSGGNSSNQVVLDDEVISGFESIEGVDFATPMVTTSFMVTAGKLQGYVSVKGLSLVAIEKLGYTVATGKMLSPMDKYGILAGSGVVNNFWNPNQRFTRNYQPPTVDLLNEKKIILNIADQGDTSPTALKFKPIDVKFVGLLESKDWDTDYNGFMNIEDVKKIAEMQRKYRAEAYKDKTQPQKGYQNAIVMCKDIAVVTDVQQKIKDQGFDAYSPTDSLKSMQSMAGSSQALLGGIGAVSLLVAAIGIANTMMTAIYERTKEIGVMKVIGATLKDIRRLFLAEAAFIGAFGGILGIGLSLIMSYILNHAGVSFFQMFSYYGDQMQGQISVIPLWLCLAAVGFTAFVGIISGYFPARRAMKLSAISAIRSD